MYGTYVIFQRSLSHGTTIPLLSSTQDSLIEVGNYIGPFVARGVDIANFYVYKWDLLGSRYTLAEVLRPLWEPWVPKSGINNTAAKLNYTSLANSFKTPNAKPQPMTMPKQAACDCGAALAKTGHSIWCSTNDKELLE